MTEQKPIRPNTEFYEAFKNVDTISGLVTVLNSVQNTVLRTAGIDPIEGIGLYQQFASYLPSPIPGRLTSMSLEAAKLPHQPASSNEQTQDIRPITEANAFLFLGIRSFLTAAEKVAFTVDGLMSLDDVVEAGVEEVLRKGNGYSEESTLSVHMKRSIERVVYASIAEQQLLTTVDWVESGNYGSIQEAVEDFVTQNPNRLINTTYDRQMEDFIRKTSQAEGIESTTLRSYMRRMFAIASWDQSPSFEEEERHILDVDVLGTAMTALSEEQKQILLAHFGSFNPDEPNGTLGIPEIARILGFPENTVRKLEKQAFSTIARRLRGLSRADLI